MFDPGERSAYPKPNDFEVMRPEYEEIDDGMIQALIDITPFQVTGVSTTRPGARRAALYQAHKTYKSYHPSYVVPSPFPDRFTDQEGVAWERMSVVVKATTGDYKFTDEDGEEDYADIEQMLLWDVRPT